MDRRRFLTSCTAALALGLARRAYGGGRGVEARDATRLPQGRVRCERCPNRCVLAPGERGRCKARINEDGVLYSRAYGNPAILRLDPVEKWPLYHFRPGARLLALGTGGCNLRCGYCQNWQLSQRRPDSVAAHDLSPTRSVTKAREYSAAGVGFAYTEPVVALEYAQEVARAARAAGLAAVAGTSLCCLPGPARDLARNFDALAVTLKAGSDAVHRQLTGMPLASIQRALAVVRASGAWLEVVSLIVPTINDTDAELQAMARHVARELGPDVPWHPTRFQPDYKLRTLPPTPLTTLLRAREIGRAAGLRHVYIGNAPGHAAANTYCPRCSTRLLLRIGTDLLESRLEAKGICPDCGERLRGVWSPGADQT